MRVWNTLKKTVRTERPSSDLRLRQNWMSATERETLWLKQKVKPYNFVILLFRAVGEKNYAVRTGHDNTI